MLLRGLCVLCDTHSSLNENLFQMCLLHSHGEIEVCPKIIPFVPYYLWIEFQWEGSIEWPQHTINLLISRICFLVFRWETFTTVLLPSLYKTNNNLFLTIFYLHKIHKNKFLANRTKLTGYFNRENQNCLLNFLLIWSASTGTFLIHQQHRIISTARKCQNFSIDQIKTRWFKALVNAHIRLCIWTASLELSLAALNINGSKFIR